MKSILSLLAGIILLVAASLPAYANYDCVGNVTFLVVDTAGNVVVAGPGGLPDVYLCNLDGPSVNGKSSASACKAMHATLLAAKLSGTPVMIDLFDNLTCATQPGWQWLQALNWVASD